MAEDCVDHCITLGRLRDEDCKTRNLHIHGYPTGPAPRSSEIDDPLNGYDPLAVYGSDAEAIRALAADEPALAERLDPDLPYIAAEIVWAARFEMARTIEDALARRTRALFLNAGSAVHMALPAAKLLAAELGRDQSWIDAQVAEFRTLAEQYQVT
jgi:glycerol-3-phosphate dehydrogenase